MIMILMISSLLNTHKIVCEGDKKFENTFQMPNRLVNQYDLNALLTQKQIGRTHVSMP